MNTTVLRTTVHAVTADVSTTKTFMMDQRQIRIGLPAGSPITSLTIYEVFNIPDPLKKGQSIQHFTERVVAAKDENGTAIVITFSNANESHPMPADMFAATQIKLVGNAVGDIYINGKS